MIDSMRDAILDQELVAPEQQLFAYPATIGRHTRSGFCQSNPSSTIDNCAAVIVTVRPCSSATGHAKRLFLQPLRQQTKNRCRPRTAL